jgi:hypothetical protein
MGDFEMEESRYNILKRMQEKPMLHFREKKLSNVDSFLLGFETATILYQVKKASERPPLKFLAVGYVMKFRSTVRAGVGAIPFF